VTEKMPQNTHLAAITAEMERLPEPSHAARIRRCCIKGLCACGVPSVAAQRPVVAHVC